MLLIRSRQPTNCFGLGSRDENSATFALAWMLEQSPALRGGLLEHCGAACDSSRIAIECQRHEREGGFTDIEIRAGADLHAIVEAKAGWSIPDRAQLLRYAARFMATPTRTRLLITLSAASSEYAGRRLEAIDGVQLVHLSWTELLQLIERTRSRTRSTLEKGWLRQLALHIQEFAVMRNPFDSRCYVVALKRAPMTDASALTWVDVVEKQRRYFHPYGKHWPLVAPAYLGFRYDGHVQSVHHVEHVEVVDSLRSVDARWPDDEGPAVLYRLGVAMKPAKPLSSKGVYPSGRVWVALDLLLSGACSTMGDARKRTAEREAKAGLTSDSQE